MKDVNKNDLSQIDFLRQQYNYYASIVESLEREIQLCEDILHDTRGLQIQCGHARTKMIQADEKRTQIVISGVSPEAIGVKFINFKLVRRKDLVS